MHPHTCEAAQTHAPAYLCTAAAQSCILTPVIFLYKRVLPTSLSLAIAMETHKDRDGYHYRRDRVFIGGNIPPIVFIYHQSMHLSNKLFVNVYLVNLSVFTTAEPRYYLHSCTPSLAPPVLPPSIIYV